jgi:iron complex transport system ATP-binding protein
MTLHVEGLCVRIGRREVVSDLGFTAAPGECVAVLGRNGAGKSTLIRGLAGLLPTRGVVRLDGRDLTAQPTAERSRQIGYVAQEGSQVAAQLTVLEFLVLAQNGHRIGWRPAPESLARAEMVLRLLRLEGMANRMPAQMSGGQRQMVSLALALVRQPRLLLLDEPTSALDLANQLSLLELVSDHTKRHGIVTVMVLHDLNMATRYADSVLMLDNGHLAHAGATEDALTHARLVQVYGVDCQILPIPGGHTAIYPLAATQGQSI